MNEQPLRTTVIGSYPFPGWLEFSTSHLDQFGPDDVREMQADAVWCAVQDQVAAGLDVITDGEQTRFDFNLSFYGYLQGIELEGAPLRRFGPPAHDQRGKHRVVGELTAPRGLGAVQEYQRLEQVVRAGYAQAASGITLKASVPGPYTLSGRLLPNDCYRDRWALTEALLPIVRTELEALVAAGCARLPWMNRPCPATPIGKTHGGLLIFSIVRLNRWWANVAWERIYVLVISRPGRWANVNMHRCFQPFWK